MFTSRLYSSPVGKGRQRRLRQPLVWQREGVRVSIPSGFVCDLHSAPWGTWNIIPPHWYPEAAWLHDYLYASGLGSRAWTDQEYRLALIALGCPSWRVALKHRVVRLGGWRAWSKWEKLRRDDLPRWEALTGLTEKCPYA